MLENITISDISGTSERNLIIFCTFSVISVCHATFPMHYY